MWVEVLTPDQTLFTGEAKVVSCPGVDGSFQILENHAPMIANLREGTLEISGDDSHSFSVQSGLVEVLKNKVIVLV
jgi:F-type H+-transporting ATPase subunit epsilon